MEGNWGRAASRYQAHWRRRQRAGSVLVTLEVSAERIARLIAEGVLPADFAERPLPEKKKLLREVVELK